MNAAEQQKEHPLVKQTGFTETLTKLMESALNLGIIQPNHQHIINLVCFPKKQAEMMITTPEKLTGNVHAKEPDILTKRMRLRAYEKLLASDAFQTLLKEIDAFKKKYSEWGADLETVQISRSSKGYEIA